MRFAAVPMVLMFFLASQSAWGQQVSVEEQLRQMQAKIDRLTKQLEEAQAPKPAATTTPAVTGSRSILETQGSVVPATPSQPLQLVAPSGQTSQAIEALPTEPLPTLVGSQPIVPATQPVIPSSPTIVHQPLPQSTWGPPPTYGTVYGTQPMVSSPLNSTATFQSPVIGGQVFGTYPPPAVPVYPEHIPPVFVEPGLIGGPIGNGVYIGPQGWGLGVGGVQLHFGGRNSGWGHPGNWNRGNGNWNRGGNGNRGRNHRHRGERDDD